MALKRPPDHRADAPIVYVHPQDDAWDMERIKSEQIEMEGRGEKPEAHPVVRYLGGHTRYDLDAESQFGDRTVAPSEYLDQSKGPTKWYLKRLGFAEWYQVQPLWERAVKNGDRPWDAYAMACRIGIKRVENGPELEGPPNNLTRKDLDTLYGFGQDLIYDLGQAVYSASMPLSEDNGEKKHYAS